MVTFQLPLSALVFNKSQLFHSLIFFSPLLHLQLKNNNADGLNKSKVIVKRKPKQLNPFHLKVGHEVLRQRKNWWKDGRFQSKWVGPCVIDYITDSGCAVLRDNTGARLKRPIKMSHLKPYVRETSEQGQCPSFPMFSFRLRRAV